MATREPPARPRIADVAREAGVSKTAVSFAFNRPDRLSTATATRILAVAARLGYRPDPVARMLTQRRTMTLGIVTPQALPTVLANPFFATFCEGAAAAAEADGYELHLLSPRDGSLAAAVRRASVDGVVALGLSRGHPELEQVRSAGLPIVLVDSDDLPEHGSVTVEDEAGARAAAAHLLGLGHRRVLVISVMSADADGASARRVPSRRLDGYRRAFRDAGLTLEDAWVVEAIASFEGGSSAFEGAWARGLRPTGVVAMSDATAIGAIRAARALGRRIPDDLSVVGFDDIPLAPDLDPPLTTVHQPIRDKGAQSIAMLLRAIASPGAGPERLRLETRLVVRGSTAPPAAAAELP